MKRTDAMNEKIHYTQIAIIVYMIQSGMVLFSLPRLTAEAFGSNGWIALIGISAIVSFNIYLISLVYKKGNGDSIFSILESTFPKIIMAPLYLFMAVLFSLVAILMSKDYILIINMTMFPDTDSNLLLGFYLLVVLFLINKGIYNIAKAAVVFFFLTIWTIFLLTFIIPEFSFMRMTPFLFKGQLDIWGSGVELYAAFLGFQLILFLIPYLQKGTPLGKAMIIGHLFTTMIYVAVCFMSYGFYSFNQLLHVLYPTLNMMKIMTTPLMERVENLTFSVFVMKMTVTTVFYYWVAIELLKQLFTKVSENRLIVIVFGATYMFVFFFIEIKREIDQVMNLIAIPEILLSFLLPLLVLFGIKVRKNKSKGGNVSG